MGLSAVIVVTLAILGTGVYLVTSSLGAPTIPAGYRAVSTPYLAYAVPGDWTPVTGPGATGLGVTFSGGAEAPGYTCGNDGYKRGIATSAFVGTGDPAQIATQFAGQFGLAFYTGTAARTPTVRVSTPQTVPVGGATGVLVEAQAVTAVDDGCLAHTGSVLVLAVPSPGGTAVLVANGDTAGGPATPPVIDRAVLARIVASASVPAG